VLPKIDGGTCQLAVFVTLAAIIITVTSMTTFLRVLRQRTHAVRAFVIGLVCFAISAGFLFSRLTPEREIDSDAFSLLLLPLLASFLAMTAAIWIGLVDGVRGRRAAFAVIGELGAGAAVVVLGLACYQLRTRDALYHAAFNGDISAANLLVSGAEHNPNDRVRRQRLLVQAANDVNLDMVRLLVSSGADPNGEVTDSTGQKTNPLIAAVSADRFVEVGHLDQTEFNVRQYRTVDYLLAKGADPRHRGTRENVTPAELARDAGLADLQKLLESQNHPALQR
jgi:hypothetical protein